METITSRKNPYILRLRELCSNGAFRRLEREFACDGRKLLQEALDNGGEILSVLWKERSEDRAELSAARQYIAPAELFDYASPMKNSPGPLFTVRMPESDKGDAFSKALILENVQDPGNVGTIIRTASAFGIDAVILCGDCADVYSPKTARATMGAIFRQRLIITDLPGLKALKDSRSLPLYGAALSPESVAVTELELSRAMVAVGSEGRGLSHELLELCDRRLIIPMEPHSESLNAAVAATVIMWEMKRQPDWG